MLENTALNSSNFFLKLESPKPLPKILPGQFVNVEIKNSDQVFLRRPFSVFEVNYQENTIGLIVKVLGKGSKTLSDAQPGESVSLVYPLGKEFTMPDKDEKILLIGGGSGVAPVLFLAKTAELNKDNVLIILGSKTYEDIILANNYLQYGRLNYTTEDGSFGIKGRVTDHTVFKDGGLNKFDKVYACGPSPMMKAIARFAMKNGIFCEVSLENLMACGFGVCLCCIEPTDKGNLCVCTDGPVFNIKSLKWQI